MRHPSFYIVAASAFGLLHVQDHKYFRSMLKRPRELDSATLKAKATLSYETS